MKSLPLLTFENAKTSKGVSLGYLTAILYMSPATQVADSANLCPASTPGCRASCLFTAGRGAFSNVRAARDRKRSEFLADKELFVFRLVQEIKRATVKAAKLNLKLCVRLNGTTDIDWENIRIGHSQENIFNIFRDIQFYDYTKRPDRMNIFLKGHNRPSIRPWPANYHLTFSRSEVNDRQCRVVRSLGGNTAEVRESITDIPKTINGDTHDLRFLDKGPTRILLKAKGKAKKDDTGFVIR